MKTPANGTVPSPCVNLCKMDEATGWCQGCLRTIDEIVAWGGLDDAAKRLVLQRLSPRRATWRALRAEAKANTAPGV